MNKSSPCSQTYPWTIVIPCLRIRADVIRLFIRELHLKTKLSIFCALLQNNQPFSDVEKYTS